MLWPPQSRPSRGRRNTSARTPSDTKPRSNWTWRCKVRPVRTAPSRTQYDAAMRSDAQLQFTCQFFIHHQRMNARALVHALFLTRHCSSVFFLVLFFAKFREFLSFVSYFSDLLSLSHRCSCLRSQQHSACLLTFLPKGRTETSLFLRFCLQLHAVISLIVSLLFSF